MKTLEEYKTYVGIMMLDLRGNWGYEYKDRIEYVNDYLDGIIQHPDADETDIKEAHADMQIGLDELEHGEYDGRVYRDCANFYGYNSDVGLTESVFNELKDDMTYPEHNLPGYEEE